MIFIQYKNMLHIENTPVRLIHLDEEGRKLPYTDSDGVKIPIRNDQRIVTIAYQVFPDKVGKNVKFAATIFKPKDVKKITEELEQLTLKLKEPTLPQSEFNKIVTEHATLQKESVKHDVWKRKSNSHTAVERLKLRPLW